MKATDSSMLFGATLVLTGLYGMYKGTKHILDGNLDAFTVLETLLGAGATATGIFTLLKTANPKIKIKNGLQIAFGVTLAVEGIGITVNGMKKLINGELTWENFFKTIGGSLMTGIGVGIATGSIFLGGIGIVIGLGISFIIAKWDDFTKDMETVLKAIEDWWKQANVLDRLKQIGAWIFTGILGGLAIVVLGIPGVIVAFFLALIQAIKSVFGIASPSKEMEPYGKFIMEGVFEGMTSLFGKVIDIFRKLKDKIGEKLIEAKNTVVDKIKTLKEKAVDKFNEVKKGISDKVTDIKTKVTDTFDRMKTKVGDIFQKMWKKIKDPINSILWGVENMANGVVNGINTVIRALNRLNVDLPNGKHFGFSIDEIGQVKLPRLAEGGTVDVGQMFIARENGAELVGQIGNRTTVMNNQQIVQAVAEGVAEAVSRVMNNGGNDYNFYLDGSELTAVIERRQARNNNIYGR